jgi:hypothetical protein
MNHKHNVVALRLNKVTSGSRRLRRYMVLLKVSNDLPSGLNQKGGFYYLSSVIIQSVASNST